MQAQTNLINDDIAPYLFSKHIYNEFVILTLYVDDINIFGTLNFIAMTIKTLKGVFEIKELELVSQMCMLSMLNTIIST